MERLSHENSLFTKLANVIQFNEKLRRILEGTEPSNWPNANWIFQELNKALNPDLADSLRDDHYLS